MPGDGYITRSNKNIFQKEGPGKLEEDPQLLQQQKSKVAMEELDEYQKMTTQQETLQKNKRTGWRNKRTIEDSTLMKNVKASMTALTNFYMEKEVPADEESYKAQLDELGKLYAQLIYDCNVYIDQRDTFLKIFHSGQGYERLCMVRTIQGKSNVEFARYRTRSRKVFEDCQNLEEGQERPLWINVLAEARTEHIDLRKSPEGSVSYMGGNTSSVIRLQSENGKVGFIKENEYNIRPGHEMLKERYREGFTELGEYKEALTTGATEEQLRSLLEFLMREYTNGAMKSLFDDKEIGAKSFELPETQYRILAVLRRKKSNQEEMSRIMEDGLLRSPEVLKLISHFTQYYFRHYLGYVVASGNTQINEGSCITNRNVANYRLAELLGLTDLIPASRNVEYIDKQGKSHKGIIMAEAKGKELLSTYPVDGKKSQQDRLICDAKFMLDMNSLQVLDIIAGQVDRHQGNLMVDYNEETKVIRKIKGIDNDMSFGTTNYFDTKYKASMKSLERDGEFALACMDERLFQRVLILNDAMIDYAFMDLLTKDELSALKARLRGVQQLLRQIRDPEEILVRPENLHVEHAEKMRKQKNCYTNMLLHFRTRAKESPAMKAKNKNKK